MVVKERPDGRFTLDLSLVSQGVLISAMTLGGGWTISSIMDMQRTQERVLTLLQDLERRTASEEDRTRDLELQAARREAGQQQTR